MSKIEELEQIIKDAQSKIEEIKEQSKTPLEIAEENFNNLKPVRVRYIVHDLLEYRTTMEFVNELKKEVTVLNNALSDKRRKYECKFC